MGINMIEATVLGNSERERIARFRTPDITRISHKNNSLINIDIWRLNLKVEILVFGCVTCNNHQHFHTALSSVEMLRFQQFLIF